MQSRRRENKASPLAPVYLIKKLLCKLIIARIIQFQGGYCFESLGYIERFNRTGMHEYLYMDKCISVEHAQSIGILVPICNIMTVIITEQKQ